uniref:Uncharacterized protein n=1 Tax=Oryza barthii TaxID=65489 RepID=A0A0D3H2D7_9ORYZ
MSTASTARSRKRAHDGSRQKVDVINLETTAPVVNTGSQHEALILRGTRTSPIDVEALDDKRRSRKIMRRSVAVVDLEKDTGPGAEKCGPNQYDACQGCSKGTNLYLSCVSEQTGQTIHDKLRSYLLREMHPGMPQGSEEMPYL